VLDAWDYMWKHLMAKVAGLWHGCAWQSLTVNSGKHGQVDVCLMKNGALH
jgi:mannose/cellobiose epimerase-like protein (N-acyl-D-glucosamine 2-epimerase family)